MFFSLDFYHPLEIWSDNENLSQTITSITFSITCKTSFTLYVQTDALADNVSSSEEEYEQNASDDDRDQVDANTSSSNETSDENSVPAKPLPIIYDCESTATDIYKDHIVEIAATAIVPENISSSSLTTNQSFQSLVCTSRRILPAGTCITK